MSSLPLIIIVVAVFVYLVGLTVYVLRIKEHYNRLLRETGKDNLTGILDTILDKTLNSEKSILQLESKIEAVAQEIVHHVQRVGVLRYNPFSDTGGDQSFVLAILDGDDTGIVLTSLHSRGITRWYAKNVKKGKGLDFELSKEEEKAIKISVDLKEGKKQNVVKTE